MSLLQRLERGQTKSEELPEEIEAFLGNCNKPVLEYSSSEDFNSSYTDFYLNHVL